MVFGLPAIGESNWGQKILDSINAVKATADAALPASQKNAASGVAPLDAAGLLPEANVPTRLTQASLSNTIATEVPAATDAAPGRVELATTAETATGTDATRAITPAAASATYAGLAAPVNNFTGKIELDGGFTNSYDTLLWIAGADRNNPTNNSQGLYIQHRVSGNLGGLVQDAGASELRLFGVSNTGAGQAAHENSLVITGGVNAAGTLIGVLANFHTEGTPTGDVSQVSLFRASNPPALPGGFTIQQLIGLHIDQQTRGTAENWSVHAPGGASLFGAVHLDSASPSAARAVQFTTNKVSRWMVRASGAAETGGNAGSDLEIVARTDAGGSNLTPLTITRSSGLVSINNGLKVAGNVGFYNATPVAKPTVSGSRGGNAALASLLTALASQGLVTDSSTA